MTFDRAQIASAVITELGEPPPGSPVSSKRFLASASTPPDPGLQARQIRRAGDNSSVTAHKTPRTESTRADLPVLTGINGVPVVATPANPAVGYAATQLPASRGRWRFWWREPQAEDTVVLSGHGFDTQNGIAVELFCDCPLGKVGPFFLQPAEHLFGKTTILLSLPAYGADAPPAGAGAFLVSNKGGAGHFSKTSNLVWVSVGVPGSEAVKASAPVVVGKVIQEGSTIRVEGSGFTSRTVINLFCGGRGDLNLGGLDPADHPKIPVTVYSSTLLSFKIPDGATSGPAYVQALKPPFRGGLGSGNGAGGSLVLQLPARADH
jgi:hypothetical protein